MDASIAVQGTRVLLSGGLAWDSDAQLWKQAVSACLLELNTAPLQWRPMTGLDASESSVQASGTTCRLNLASTLLASAGRPFTLPMH